VDSDSWGPIKQPYVASADFQDQFVEVSFPPLQFGILAILSYFLICDDFNENFQNLQDQLIQPRGTFGIFFRIFRLHLSPGTRFFAGKGGFDTFEVINHAILDLLGHGIQILDLLGHGIQILIT